MTTFNLKGKTAAQDMIRIIMEDKGLTTVDSVLFAINRDIHQCILKKGYASIALDLWGHDDPERKRKPLKDKCIEIELDKLRQNLIEDIMEKQNVDCETALCYFLIFTMDVLGYHI